MKRIHRSIVCRAPVARQTASASAQRGAERRARPPGIGRYGAAAILYALLSALPVHAAPGALNDTGQTQCYDDGFPGLEGDCAVLAAEDGVRPSQDARFGRDAAASAGTLGKAGDGAAGFDFTKVCMDGTEDCAGDANTGGSPAAGDWACTRDNHTGLLWSIETIGGVTWAQATDIADGSAIDGYNDAARCGLDSGWRLPTRRELLSIMHFGTSSPAIDGDHFPDTPDIYYWTATEHGYDTSEAWEHYFGSGGTWASGKGATDAARLVHGEVADEPDFIDNGDGTVTDDVTGLVWDRCALGQVWDSGGGSCAGTPIPFENVDAFLAAAQANAANHLGYADWRLPNVKELESLVRTAADAAPAIDPDAFPDTPADDEYDGFWSSTVHDGDGGWYVHFGINYADLLGSFGTCSGCEYYVRLVRGGDASAGFDALAVTAIPTLSEWGLILLVLLLGGAAFVRAGRSGRSRA